MATILRKTSKGADEIATRVNRLAPRLRSALILVDGTRDEVELGKLIAQNSAETLQELLTQGFVEVAAVTEAPPKPGKAVAAEADKKEFNAFRAEAVRAFNDLVGPPGDSLAMRMEKTTTREELAPLLQLAFQLIGTSRGGQQAAAQFKARFASF
jgi:hypothetical protein